MDILKIPPHNKEAEQSILGAIMIDNSCIRKVVGIITPDCFYFNSHRLIYEAMLELKNEPIDLITLPTILQKTDILASAGGVSYLAALLDSTPTAANVSYYVNIVREFHNRRRLIQECQSLITDGYDGSIPEAELISRARRLSEVIKTGISSVSHISTTISCVVKEVEILSANNNYISGIPSGFTKIDSHTGGWQAGDFIIIAGRPSMGKSILVKDFILNSNIPALIFSLEMSKEEYAKRMLSGISQIEHEKIRTGRIYGDEWGGLVRASGILGDMNIYITDEARLSDVRIFDIAEREKIKHNIGMIVVDYLQLVTPAVKERGRNREQEVADISRNLKAIAKELKVPVICVASLNRMAETREDKRPGLSDLRESGSLEYEADMVCFLYQPAKYNFNDSDIPMLYGGYKKQPKTLAGLTEFTIAKGRNIRTGAVRLLFRGGWQRFDNLEEED